MEETQKRFNEFENKYNGLEDLQLLEIEEMKNANDPKENEYEHEVLFSQNNVLLSQNIQPLAIDNVSVMSIKKPSTNPFVFTVSLFLDILGWIGLIIDEDEIMAAFEPVWNVIKDIFVILEDNSNDIIALKSAVYGTNNGADGLLRKTNEALSTANRAYNLASDNLKLIKTNTTNITNIQSSITTIQNNINSLTTSLNNTISAYNETKRLVVELGVLFQNMFETVTIMAYDLEDLFWEIDDIKVRLGILENSSFKTVLDNILIRLGLVENEQSRVKTELLTLSERVANNTTNIQTLENGHVLILNKLDDVIFAIEDLEFNFLNALSTALIISNLNDIKSKLDSNNVLTNDLIKAVNDTKTAIVNKLDKLTVLDSLAIKIDNLKTEIVTLKDSVLSLDTKIINKMNEIITTIKDIKMPVDGGVGGEAPDGTGGTIWDFLGDLLAFVEGFIDTVISLVIPDDMEFMQTGFNNLSDNLNEKFSVMNDLKTSVTSAFSTSGEKFEIAPVSLPNYGTIQLMDLTWLHNWIGTFKMLVSGFLYLLTAIWSYKKITNGLIT